MVEPPELEGRRSAAFARLQETFPLTLSTLSVTLPAGFTLEDDEFVVRSARDWGVGVDPLVLTTQRLVCPTDLTLRTVATLRLSNVLSVSLRKHLIGFSTIVIEAADRRPVSFPAHINGPLMRSDIAATVDYAKNAATPERSGAKPWADSGDRYEQLRRIGELKQSGVLSEAEFAEEKARILKQP